VGTLEVTGTIALSQFWPKGSADADTVKIEVLLAAPSSSFRFTPSGSSSARVTKAFEGASVRGKTRQPAIRQKKTGEPFITVRLQGVDAPELHYRPSAELNTSDQTDAQHELYLELNEDYRQPVAESSTVALAELLHGASRDGVTLPCRVRTQVNSPDEVFDTYGRFVGNIFIQINRKWLDVNTWLAEQGWAFPTFYNSMTPNEIEELVDATNRAFFDGRGIWANVPDDVGRLDWASLYRTPKSMKDASFVIGDDSGPAIYPKLFRRLSTWEINRRAKMVAGGLLQYMARRSDRVYRTDDFLLNGHSAETYQLDDFISPGTMTVLFWPEELVFVESKSGLVDANGNRVTTW
jgi:endonuclease YncB( thermonuclease family)